MAGARQVDAVFRALGNARRRQILRLLREQPRSPAEIAKAFDVTWPAVSRHLRVLEAAKLVETTEKVQGGKRLVFELGHGALVVAQAWLKELTG